MSFSFEREGFTVHCADTVKAGGDIFNRHTIDLVILDLNLPDGDGLDFCKEIREKSRVPIIMLTARDLEAEELSGLAAGADDYITKPFSVSILRARVESVLRRLDGTAKHTLRSGGFKLDTSHCKLFRGDEEIPISTTEYRLLKYLIGNAGKVLSKEQILTELWENQEGYIDDNTLPVNINRLRSKIEENPKKPQFIKTIYGIGYAWAEA
jgi:DNA-binding response OmpR family regulator